MLKQIKSLIRDQLGLSPAIVLVATGCVAYLLLNLLLRKPLTSAWGLLAPFLLGIAIESYEIWLQYRNVGLLAPGNDPLVFILARHGLDVLIILVVPALLVTLGLFQGR